ncbi:hypothetical protein EJO68_04180 [Variovorax atrisoli]|uniref:hypothetical protein n=1 Tax=Variovorax atrisoli TaxID=3394203 RepID=UPI000F7E725E|nr:hypothetical protein [Variovorax sp. 369]RTD98577.1 hypothetical protein EJO68_04180 [Variovorax sp. 369]
MSHFDLTAKLAADAKLPTRVVQALLFSDSVNLDTPDNARSAVARAAEICGIFKVAASAYREHGIDPEIEMAHAVKSGAAAPAYRAAVLNKLAQWDEAANVSSYRSQVESPFASSMDEIARQFYADREAKAEAVAVLKAEVKTLRTQLRKHAHR